MLASLTQIQKAWKLRTQGDIHALSQGILKFRRRINDLLQASLVPENTEQFEKENIARQEERDDLLGIGRVVRLQRERLERMMKEERELGVKHANLSRDIQSLAALSKVFVKEKEFAIKHAIDPVKERKMRNQSATDRRKLQCFYVQHIRGGQRADDQGS